MDQHAYDNLKLSSKKCLEKGHYLTIRIRADNASNRSIRPDNGSPTALATFIASSAWRQPITPGTERRYKQDVTFFHYPDSKYVRKLNL